MRVAFVLSALTVALAGCATDEYQPLTMVDPDPVYRESAQHSEQMAYPDAPIDDPQYQRVGRVHVVQAAAPAVVEPGSDDMPMTRYAIAELEREAEQAQRDGDAHRMVELYQQAAPLGSMQAHYELARHYMAGEILPKNPAAAVEHLRTADAIGAGEGTRVLAWLYLKGNTVGLDVPTGEQLMRRAATASPRAQRELGMLLCGLYAPNLGSCSEGVGYLQQAAQGGDADAAYLLATKNLVGKVEAARAMKLAADAGHPIAAMIVADRSIETEGEYAGELYKRAALHGNTEAMLKLATALLLGKIPAIDAERQAYVWYSVAEALGNERARAEKAAIEGAKVAADELEPGAVDAEIQALISTVQAAGAN